MIDPTCRKLIGKIVLLLALLTCLYFQWNPPQAFALTTCQQNCENRAGTCEIKCQTSGQNVRLCVEGCQAALSACLTLCNRQ